MPRVSYALLIDDNATTRFLQRRLLGRLAQVGSFHEAGSVAEGLHCLQRLLALRSSEESVLVLLDGHLPSAGALLGMRDWINALPRVHIVGTQVHPLSYRVRGICIDRPLAIEQLRTLLATHFAYL